MYQSNILENLELKLQQTKAENKEKIDKIENEFKTGYSAFLENIFKNDSSGIKRFVSAYFQLEKLDNPEKSDNEIFFNSLNKSVENLYLSKEKKENLVLKISNLEKNKDFFSEKIIQNSDISKDVNYPLLEDLEKKWILTKTDLIDISLKYKEKKDFLSASKIIWESKFEIIKKSFFDLNDTKSADRIENFKTDFSSEIENSKNIQIYPNLLNFVGRNYSRLRLRDKVESKAERLRRMFKIAFLKLYRLKYSGIDINEIIRKIENLDDLDSMISLLLKFFEQLKQNPVLQKDYVVSDEIDEVESIVNEAEDNKQKSIFNETTTIKASQILEEIENKLTSSDLEKILSDKIDLVWGNFIDREVSEKNKILVQKEKLEKQKEEKELDKEDLMKIFEETKQEMFELEEQKRNMFLTWEYDKIDALNDKLIEIMKKLEKLKKLLWIWDTDELNEEENITTF